MALVKTKGIVLHAIPYMETSLIARVLSPEYGVISVVAKGAKRKKSVTGVHFSFMNTLSLEVYYSPLKDLHTLKESELLENASVIAEHILPHAVTQLLAEIVIRNVKNAEGSDELYSLLSKGVSFLKTDKDFDTNKSYLFISRFIIHISKIFGFEINFENCIECFHLLNFRPALFSIERGGYICHSCGDGEPELEKVAQVLLYIGTRKEVPRELVPLLNRVEELLFRYISLHMGTHDVLKSYKYLKTVRAF